MLCWVFASCSDKWCGWESEGCSQYHPEEKKNHTVNGIAPTVKIKTPFGV